MKKYFFLILVISIISVWPFFRKGYIKSDDGEWMIIRFTAFHQSLIDGQVPVRFTKRLNNNYGYPVFNFLYPAPFYFSEIPKILGFTFVDSIKFTFITSALGSSLLMFWALSKKYDNLASLTGALVYLFAPYRFADMYIRGSIGESFAFLMPPVVLASIYNLKNGKALLLPISSISIGILTLSHNVSTVLFLPVLVGYATTILDKSKFLQFLKYTVLGILMSSFFSLPALVDLHYVRLSQIKITETTTHLISYTSTIGSPIISILDRSPNNILQNIGPITLLGIAGGFCWLLKNKKDFTVKYSLFVIIFCVFLMTEQSSFFWKAVPGLDVIQFPWRLLSVVVLFTSILVSQTLHGVNKILVTIFLIAISIATTIPYTINLPRTVSDDNYYSTNEDTTTVKDEYMPLWVKEKPTTRASSVSVPNPDIKTTKELMKGLKYMAILSASKDTTLTLNTIYFPGFKAKIDNKKAVLKYENINGLISIALPKGVHEVIIYFGKTPVHFVSELVSLFAFCTALVMLYKLWQKQNS